MNIYFLFQTRMSVTFINRAEMEDPVLIWTGHTCVPVRGDGKVKTVNKMSMSVPHVDPVSTEVPV